MVLRARRLQISRFAHNQALHFLARAREHGLVDAERRQLIEVVNGYTDRCDEAAARVGIEWMREQARHKGERVRF